ncbi:hypothetical protein P171DRAFT_439164 [Karstenula rhodostoma CBS 690.94]|uniref:Uncharacterized protein n=1 Tax=Karstenula rhodostoma CBS 690.94 TaxID=1392251 RepID=A0A9P4UID7_9PLEO|nr:hypothetical protein P171DRAFT_439164 [Karstenula rhodostoma CBS 690.94]
MQASGICIRRLAGFHAHVHWTVTLPSDVLCWPGQRASHFTLSTEYNSGPGTRARSCFHIGQQRSTSQSPAHSAPAMLLQHHIIRPASYPQQPHRSDLSSNSVNDAGAQLRATRPPHRASTMHMYHQLNVFQMLRPNEANDDTAAPRSKRQFAEIRLSSPPKACLQISVVGPSTSRLLLSCGPLIESNLYRANCRATPLSRGSPTKRIQISQRDLSPNMAISLTSLSLSKDKSNLANFAITETGVTGETLTVQ